MPKTECTRFRVIDGKSEIVDEWMRFLNENNQNQAKDNTNG